MTACTHVCIQAIVSPFQQARPLQQLLSPAPLLPPSCCTTEQDSFLVLASDGLFAEEERGGGGGLDNETVAELCAAAGSASCQQLAETMASAAQEVGSTDDVTLVVMRLSSA